MICTFHNTTTAERITKRCRCGRQSPSETPTRPQGWAACGGAPASGSGNAAAAAPAAVLVDTDADGHMEDAEVLCCEDAAPATEQQPAAAKTAVHAQQQKEAPRLSRRQTLGRNHLRRTGPHRYWTKESRSRRGRSMASMRMTSMRGTKMVSWMIGGPNSCPGASFTTSRLSASTAYWTPCTRRKLVGLVARAGGTCWRRRRRLRRRQRGRCCPSWPS